MHGTGLVLGTTTWIATQNVNGIGQPCIAVCMRAMRAMRGAGAGSACEGEDWIGATQLSQLSVGVTHVYWRQTEVRGSSSHTARVLEHTVGV